MRPLFAWQRRRIGALAASGLAELRQDEQAGAARYCSKCGQPIAGGKTRALLRLLAWVVITCVLIGWAALLWERVLS